MHAKYQYARARTGSREQSCLRLHSFPKLRTLSPFISLLFIRQAVVFVERDPALCLKRYILTLNNPFQLFRLSSGHCQNADWNQPETSNVDDESISVPADCGNDPSHSSTSYSHQSVIYHGTRWMERVEYHIILQSKCAANQRIWFKPGTTDPIGVQSGSQCVRSGSVQLRDVDACSCNPECPGSDGSHGAGSNATITMATVSVSAAVLTSSAAITTADALGREKCRQSSSHQQRCNEDASECSESETSQYATNDVRICCESSVAEHSGGNGEK